MRISNSDFHPLNVEFRVYKLLHLVLHIYFLCKHEKSDADSAWLLPQLSLPQMSILLPPLLQ